MTFPKRWSWLVIAAGAAEESKSQPGSLLGAVHPKANFGNPVSAKNTLVAGFALVIVAFSAMFVYTIARVLLLIFAGILIAVFLSGCGQWISRRTGLSYRISVSLTILSLFVLFALSAWLIAPNIQEQAAHFSEAMSNQLGTLQQQSQSQWFDMLRAGLEKLLATLSPVRKISDWFVDLVVIFFTSIYLAFEPKLYRRGVVALVPSTYRKKTVRALDRLGETLWRWFIGRLIGMAVIGLLVSGSMWAVGIPLAFTLGLIAAVLEFIPYVGALASSLPALLLAAQQGWRTTWIVLVLYLAVHAIDGYIVIPLVERKAVRIPPALTIIAQLSMFMTASFLGVLVADPLAACGLVLLERFYLDKTKAHKTSQVPQEAGV